MTDTISTTARVILKTGNQDTPFIFEAPILNTDVIFIGLSLQDMKGGDTTLLINSTKLNVWTVSAGSKLRFQHFKGNLWAVANSGTQTFNINNGFNSEAGEDYTPEFFADVSAFFVAALPIDLLLASGQSYAGQNPVVIAQNTYIFAAGSSAFVGESTYNVAIQVEIYIYSDTSGNLTVYRTDAHTTAQATEVFAVTLNVPSKLLIPLDVGETFNLKFSQNANFLKFVVRQIGVTYASVS